jgi:hypothetical protein
MLDSRSSNQISSLVRVISSRATEPLVCFTRAAAGLLPHAYCGNHVETHRQYFIELLTMMLSIGLDVEKDMWLQKCIAMLDQGWDCNALTEIARLLIKFEELIDTNHQIGPELLLTCLFMPSFGNSIDRGSVVEFLSAVIGALGNVNYRDSQGLTLSMYAHAKGFWGEWIEALERNSMQIEDDLQEEGNSWLLGQDWRSVWIEHGYPLWCLD